MYNCIDGSICPEMKIVAPQYSSHEKKSGAQNVYVIS